MKSAGNNNTEYKISISGVFFSITESVGSRALGYIHYFNIWFEEGSDVPLQFRSPQ